MSGALKGMVDGQLRRPPPLRDRVYETLLELIVTRDLPPGQHLVESDLASQLGVSRQPVREALQRLSNEGWVDLRPGHGAFVHEPSETEAEQLLAVRAILETESARLAAHHADAAGVESLWELWRIGLAAVDSAEVDAVVTANADFHRRITELSGNRVLSDLAAQVDRRVRWFYAPVARARGKASWDEHAEIIEAIAAGSGAEASRLMEAHTDRTRLTYHQLANRNA